MLLVRWRPGNTLQIEAGGSWQGQEGLAAGAKTFGFKTLPWHLYMQGRAIIAIRALPYSNELHNGWVPQVHHDTAFLLDLCHCLLCHIVGMHSFHRH